MDVVRDELRLRAMVIQFPHYFESQLDGQDMSHSIGKMEISDFLPIAFPKCPYFFFFFIFSLIEKKKKKKKQQQRILISYKNRLFAFSHRPYNNIKSTCTN